MLTTLVAVTMLSAAQVDAGTMHSVWFTDVRQTASHDVPSYGAGDGVYMMQTFVALVDKWVNERVAVGGALTFAYHPHLKVPTVGVMELRLSGRKPLTDRLFLVGVASVGYPVMRELKARVPSVGADIGVGIRLRPHLSLRVDVGLFYASFKSVTLEATNDREVVDVERRLSLMAARVTAGIAADF